MFPLPRGALGAALFFAPNHSLGEWSQKAYGDKQEKNSLCYNESAVCQLHKE